MGDVEDLAGFILARTYDPEVGEADRLRCESVLAAFGTHMAQAETEALMRGIGAKFADHPDYRYEWRPGLQQREVQRSGLRRRRIDGLERNRGRASRAQEQRQQPGTPG